MAFSKRADKFGSADARGHGKRAQIIGEAGLFGSDEVGQRILGFALRLLHLLPQRIEGRQQACARRVRVELDVVAHAIRREKTGHAARGELLLADDFMQQLLRVVEKLLGLGPDGFVLEDARINALQLPGVEKWRPVDQRNQQRRAARFPKRARR